ncbi:MAG: hypothetical protein JAY74_20355 [Candidatus Thiodiazotropha taylori]|nr:hypothetical protein [Candidatus Thiodiazotropha taylori]
MDALPLFQHWGRGKMVRVFLPSIREERGKMVVFFPSIREGNVEHNMRRKNGGVFLPSIRERNTKRNLVEFTFLALGRETENRT